MIDDNLLGRVVGPARYIGCEHNIVEKAPEDVALRFALCFPDVYEVGSSHVGSGILYHVLNSREDTYCERAYHPWPDATAIMQQESIPLATLETHTPLSDFHAVGISLSHELNYTTALSLLALGGIPLRASARVFSDPIVIAGGPCTVNPEPLAAFFDLMVVGDGEEVVCEIAELLIECGVPFASSEAREEFLRRAADIEGVYVPALWNTVQAGHFVVASPAPGQQPVRRRIVQDLNSAAYPTAPIVPFKETIHDRGQVEISRGCSRGCRFCQAGMIYRPVRERTVDTLRQQAKEIIRNTGYDQISLTSLSCTDHSRISEVLEALHEDLSEQRVSIGLPSIRVDKFGLELAKRVQRVKKSGLTFAPEAGTQRMRDSINKGVTEEDLREAVLGALRAGWHKIKLYFMIGFPGETDEDVIGIIETVEALIREGRAILGNRAGKLTFNVSVALLIPKPHTPYQWVAQDTRGESERKRELLRTLGRHVKHLKLHCHESKEAVLEAYLARADRTAADVIESAYNLGAVLDEWTEQFDFGIWERAASEHGLNIYDEAASAIPVDASLPWDHIDTGVTKSFLQRELERSAQGVTTPYCLQDGCCGCGVSHFVDECPGVPQPTAEEACDE